MNYGFLRRDITILTDSVLCSYYALLRCFISTSALLSRYTEYCTVEYPHIGTIIWSYLVTIYYHNPYVFLHWLYTCVLVYLYLMYLRLFKKHLRNLKFETQRRHGIKEGMSDLDNQPLHLIICQLTLSNEDMIQVLRT